jgi:competence protein ComGC
MLHGLARLTSVAFAVVECAMVLTVLLVLGITAIPSLVRTRKR